ncbi:MAG: DUF2662 domain-containing protein [Actinobacteria bacterium]|nr:MAG: DUF2662 domain-containing protein [Actinomycetota bacterium]
MSILSDFEDRVAGAVEGLFAGAFRSPVQPAEIAKKCGKAMDDGRVVGVGKVYAPTSYTVVISEADEERMEGFIEVLEGELATYLVGYAQERGYDLAQRPVVLFEVDDEFRLGRVEVETKMSRRPVTGELGADDVAERPDSSASDAGTPATVTVTGLDHDVVLAGGRVVVGRLAECGVVLADSNVSRRHAAFTERTGGWEVEDLGSTNGTFLNGRPLTGAELLRDGDVVQVGVTKLVYNAPGAGR